MKKFSIKGLAGVLMIAVLVLVSWPAQAQDGDEDNACAGTEGKETCLATLQTAYRNFNNVTSYQVSFSQENEQLITSGEGLLAVNIDQELSQDMNGVIEVGQGVLGSQVQSVSANSTTLFTFDGLTPEPGNYMIEVVLGDRILHRNVQVVADASPVGDTFVVRVGQAAADDTINVTTYFSNAMPVQIALVTDDSVSSGEVEMRIVDTEDSLLTLEHELEVSLAGDTASQVSRVNMELLQVGGEIYVRGNQISGELPFYSTNNWVNIRQDEDIFPGYTVLNTQMLRDFTYSRVLENPSNVLSINQLDVLNYELELNPLVLAESMDFSGLFVESEQETAQRVINAILNSENTTITQTITVSPDPNSEDPTIPFVVNTVETTIVFDVELSSEITGDAPINLSQSVTTSVTVSEVDSQDVTLRAPNFTFGG